MLDSLSTASDRIRHLDLSYNSLNRHDTPDDQQPFIQSLTDFLKKAKSLTHFLISGMELQEEPILEICEIIADSPTILSAHLSDLGIMNELADEVLDIFQIEFSHLDIQPAIDQSFGDVVSKEFRNMDNSMKNESSKRKSMIEYKNYLVKGAKRKNNGY